MRLQPLNRFGRWGVFQQPAKMNQAKLNSIVIALPPLAEQSRIVTRVTALRRLCADLRQRLAERQSVQARLAEALVGQAGST